MTWLHKNLLQSQDLNVRERYLKIIIDNQVVFI